MNITRTTGMLALIAMLAAGCASRGGTVAYNATCVTNTTYLEVRGTSLSGVIAEGTTVRVLEGYQACNNLSRGDIVIYRYAGNPDPLIKQVKAVPGDKWHLDGCNIIVNEKKITTSDGTPYCVGTGRLSLYTHDYPIIPAGTYLIMGNSPAGTLDSSVFGLVDKTDIIGKVES